MCEEFGSMIGYIKGEVAQIQEGRIIVDNHGIGYLMLVPGSVLDRIRIGDEVKMHTYLQVKEDGMQLFGFLSADDLNVFQLLLGVNGIGPKAALGILSGLGTDNLRFAVLAEDAAAIAKAPGVGKKTAQKLILELKDKFSLEDAFEQKLTHVQEEASAAGNDGACSEAVQALVALGYSGTEALKAVNRVENAADMDVEQILKAALKRMI